MDSENLLENPEAIVPQSLTERRQRKKILEEKYVPSDIHAVKHAFAEWGRLKQRGFAPLGSNAVLVPSLLHIALYSYLEDGIRIVPSAFALTGKGGFIHFAANRTGMQVLSMCFEAMCRHLSRDFSPLETTRIELQYLDNPAATKFGIEWLFDSPSKVEASQINFNLLLAVGFQSGVAQAASTVDSAHFGGGDPGGQLPPFYTNALLMRKHSGLALPEIRR